MFVYIGSSFVTWIDKNPWIRQASTNIPMDMAGIAIALRDTLIQCREPDYINGWITLTSNLKLEAVNTGKRFFGPLDDNHLAVNSNIV